MANHTSGDTLTLESSSDAMRTCPDSFIVALLGARMNYAVPHVLCRAGALEQLFTDFCATKGVLATFQFWPESLRPAKLKRFLSRQPDGIPAAKISQFRCFGIEYARRRTQSKSPTEITRTYLWANRAFGRLVSKAQWGRAQAVYAFNCAALEVLQRARREGLRTVLEQTIAPYGLEQRILKEERQAHPGWEEIPEDRLAGEYAAREQEEWGFAERILCGSDFVRQGIAACAGPVDKCVLVPYGIDFSPSPNFTLPEYRKREPRPLRVLVAGTVCLRKGSPYVLEAARRLSGEAHIRMAGTIQITPHAQALLAAHVELLGSLPRSEMKEQFAWADLFLLPSLCEGSATVCYEALAWGLPVICTPNSGSIVRHGLDGFIIPPRNVQPLVAAIQKLEADCDLLEQMSRNAKERAKQFTLEAYGRRLLRFLF